MDTAHLLGTQAVGLKLETLDLAAIHHRALSILESSGGTPLELAAMTRLATEFFAATLLPIEATHPTALEASSSLERLNAELARITQKLEGSTRDLERGIVERKTAENALRMSGERSAKLLDESQQLYSNVQELARKTLGANEEERRSLSRLLQDEIAQSLLGIHVRLLVLRGEVTATSESVRKEVDLTQRLVRKTESTINRILRDFEIPHES
jgi:signal transduction histidine kinase